MGNKNKKGKKDELRDAQDGLYLAGTSNPTVKAGRVHVELGSFEIDRIDGVYSEPKFNPFIYWLISMSFYAVPVLAKVGGSSINFIVPSLFLAIFLSMRTHKSEPFEVYLLVGGTRAKAASFAHWDGRTMNEIRAKQYQDLIEEVLEKAGRKPKDMGQHS